MADLKKAFELMKKELKKETGISGGFTMSAKQIENRTATYLVCNLIPYEKEIARIKASCERVRGYNTWTDAEKERFCNDYEQNWIPYFEKQIEDYGTKENYANVIAERIVNSKAFSKFSETIGGVRYHLESKRESGLDVMYLRFNY